ncbi:MAG: hypothetical protein GY866_27860 [Proteobacteria bacterium]|nr:hypothetical protein [Pseudomonadota bacterium]
MNSIAKDLKKIELAEKKKRRRSNYRPSATREEIERALSEYLANGGRITRIEPEWIEEGEIYIFG